MDGRVSPRPLCLARFHIKPQVFRRPDHNWHYPNSGAHALLAHNILHAAVPGQSVHSALLLHQSTGYTEGRANRFGNSFDCYELDNYIHPYVMAYLHRSTIIKGGGTRRLYRVTVESSHRARDSWNSDHLLHGNEWLHRNSDANNCELDHFLPYKQPFLLGKDQLYNGHVFIHRVAGCIRIYHLYAVVLYSDFCVL